MTPNESNVGSPGGPAEFITAIHDLPDLLYGFPDATEPMMDARSALAVVAREIQKRFRNRFVLR